MRGVLALLVFTLLTAVFAGCVGEQVPLEPTVPFVDVRAAEPATTFDLLNPTTIVPVTATHVSNGAEPTIQASQDGSVLWIGDHLGGYRSFDGGVTWQTMANPMLQTFIFDGWDFAEDDDGVLYATTTNGQVIQVVRSTNDGLSWDILTRFYPSAVGGVADRPWIDARGSGDILLIFNDSGFTNRCQRSFTGGLEWLDQSELAGRPISGGVELDENGYGYWSSTNGFVYRIRPNTLRVPDTCFNGFKSNLVAVTPNGETLQSQIAVEDNKAYVAYPTEDNDANKISAIDYATNTIKEFSFGVPELKSNTFQTVAVHEGRVYSAWYGSEGDGDFGGAGFDDWWNVYLAAIDDFWTPNPTVQIFTVALNNHKGEICMSGVGCDLGGGLDRDLLDYFGIDVDQSGRVHIAYGHDGDTSSATVRYAGLTVP